MDSDTGAVAELAVDFVDVTYPVADHAQQRARKDVSAAAASRGVIEQAEGVIIAAFDADQETAFEMLKRAARRGARPAAAASRRWANRTQPGRRSAEGRASP
jgi:hypothetical protein